ncbi:peptidoglycan D,D-transpeptidase FtsI family protein [Tengunoibacter tsumagoiensis]|nr:penicillin-binding protein 2 [Tengunoibacter tsumagoiensis]
MSTELRRARQRQMIIFLLVCAVVFALLARLFYWQILESYSGYRLAAQANAEHVQNQIIPAPRGHIYDVDGRLLATNVVRDDVYIEPIQFTSDHPDNYQADLQVQVAALHGVLPALSEESLLQAFGSGRPTVRIAGPIEPEQSEKLRKMRLPDTFLEPRPWRVYPNNDLAAQMLGYVQESAGQTRGIYGLEAKYDQLLAGKPGNFTAETDLMGNPLTVGTSSGSSAISGADLTVTVKSDVQQIVQSSLAETVQQMGAQSGTALVLNAQTGAIVAMAGYPAFDPNDYGNYADQKGCLGQQEVYYNPALYCAYEPGSTMKAITMAAALDQKLITPEQTIQDPGYLDFPDGTPTVTNWERQGYGTESMTQVLEHSANVGAAYVAYNVLGPDRFYPYLQRFGFGTKTGLLSPETGGGYRTPSSQGWTKSDMVRQSFGQSITATPLQIARAYQAIANGGVMMQPYLVSQIVKNGQVQTIQPRVEQRVISAEAAKQLTGMLVSAANANQQATIPGYSVAVKTGTATTQGLAEDQTEASMAGFLPASQPRFVILVKLDRPQNQIYGGTAAGPLWKTIAQQLMAIDEVPPDLPLH